MPTIEVSKKDLESLVMKKFSAEQLEEALLYTKCEIDAIGEDKDTLKIDVKDSNRPDLWSTEGIARDLRSKLGIKKGLAKYKIENAKTELIVEKEVLQVRPLIAACVIRNAKISEELLLQLIQLQEKICQTFGRKREEVAIGLYDFDKLKPPMFYTAFRPREKKFIPLEFKNEMDLDEILELHPKGKEFGNLLKGKEKYPILMDSTGNVASMPPIINSQLTGKVSEETKNLLVEVTGFREKFVLPALNVMVCALAERGFEIEAVKIKFPNKKTAVTPNLSPKKHLLEIDYFNKIAGMQLNAKQIIELLERAGYGAKASGKKIEVLIPPYRQDILHQIDIAEDALVSFGYNKIPSKEIGVFTIGKESAESKKAETLREICIGMGLQEILTFTLSSREKQETKMNLKRENFAEIANPMSENYSIYRKSLVPEMLEFLSRNKGAGFPQKIFEIGKCIELDPSMENGVDEKTKLCVAISHSRTNFSEIKSFLEMIASNLAKKTELRETIHSALENGRAAEISIAGKKGIIGEINSKVKKNFLLDMEVTVFEIEI